MSPAAPGPGVSCPTAGRTRCCVGQGSARSPGGGGCTQSPAPREQHSRGQGSIPHTPLLCHVPSRVPTPQLLKQCPHFLGMRGHRACPALSPVPPGGCAAAVPMRSRDAPPLARSPVASPSLQLPARGQSSAACAPTHTPHRFPARLPAVFGAATGSRPGCERLLGAQPPKVSERCVWPVPRLSFRSRTVLGLQLANASVCT